MAFCLLQLHNWIEFSKNFAQVSNKNMLCIFENEEASIVTSILKNIISHKRNTELCFLCIVYEYSP